MEITWGSTKATASSAVPGTHSAGSMSKQQSGQSKAMWHILDERMPHILSSTGIHIHDMVDDDWSVIAP
jgi:hypothetical protein